jgi:hypothetical protein
MGFVGGVQDVPPATVAAVGELMPAVSMPAGGTQTVPSQWASSSKSELAGPFPWYKALNGAADTTEEAPGLLVFAGTSTQAFNYEFFVTFEFKTAVDPANTPAALALRRELTVLRLEAARLREKKALEGVLGGTVVVLPSGTTRQC